MNRRTLLKGIPAAALAMRFGKTATAYAATGPTTAANTAAATGSFPKGFLWGAATSAYQVEGNNINTDLWLIERLPNSMFKEHSGDACDQYHLFRQDISMLADLGLNTYRFSIEWARIEPDEGEFSRAELEHYKRVLEACHKHNITPLVTLYHVSMPRWVAYKGGWENPQTADWYARYCERVGHHLGDRIAYAATFNEPNLPSLFRWMSLSPDPNSPTLGAMMLEQRDVIRRQLNAPMFTSLLNGDIDKSRANLMAGHTKGKAALKAARPDLPVGFTLSMEDDQPAGPDSLYRQKQADVYDPWLELAQKDDYVGVQTYTRSLVAKRNELPPKGAEVTQAGFEFYPEALEHTVRYAAAKAKVPVLITENGVATDDDTLRIEYIRRAVAGVKRCLDDGVDVRSYVHWSLLDNFEWIFGYGPKYGLVAVDRTTQMRTIKPSAVVLGNMARRNSI